MKFDLQSFIDSGQVAVPKIVFCLKTCCFTSEIGTPFLYQDTPKIFFHCECENITQVLLKLAQSLWYHYVLSHLVARPMTHETESSHVLLFHQCLSIYVKKFIGLSTSQSGHYGYQTEALFHMQHGIWIQLCSDRESGPSVNTGGPNFKLCQLK